MDLHSLIAENWAWPYVYLAIFGGTFIEGETFILFAGFAAAQGMLNAPALLIAAWLGSFSGDQCYFWIGRRFGLRLLSRRPAWRERVDASLAWLKRYDTGFILSFRFIYGVRNLASFTLGISGIAWQRFLVLNLIAAFVWAAVFVGTGYLCGHAITRIAGQYAQQFSLMLLGVFIVVVTTAIIWHRARQRRRRRADAAVSLSD